MTEGKTDKWTKSENKVEFQEIEGRPQVVLVGNGIDRYVGGEEWNELIVKGFDNFCAYDDDVLKMLPLPTRFEIYASHMRPVSKMKEKLSEVLNNINDEVRCKYDNNLCGKQLLNQLLHLDIDAIITTNFTKSLEFYCEEEPKTKKSQKELKMRDAVKNSLYTFREIKYSGKKQKVYYAHGIMETIDSVVLSQRSYDQQLYEVYNCFANSKVTDFNGSNSKGQSTTMCIYNWVDLFRIADIHIVGFGLDFAEIDIWALIKLWNEIVRKNLFCGTITYYTPTVRSTTYNREEHLSYIAKKSVLKNNDVSVENCGCMSKPQTAEEWAKFYATAIDRIGSQISKRRDSLPKVGAEIGKFGFVVDNN